MPPRWRGAGREAIVKVTNYLEQARVCAALAERLSGQDRKQLLEMAHEWLTLAKQAANDAAADQPATRS
jgi:hypothetical protein